MEKQDQIPSSLTFPANEEQKLAGAYLSWNLQRLAEQIR